MRQTRYRQLRETLAAEILDGHYGQGRLPTEAELCRRFALSRATVGRAMAELVAEGMIERRPGAGSFVRDDHRGPVIGLLAPGLADTELLAPLERDLREVVSARRGRLICGSRDPHESEPDRLLAPLLAAGIDGLIYAALERPAESETINRAICARLRARRLPLVLFDRDIVRLPERGDADLVACDHVHGAFQLGDLLLRRGRQRVLFCRRPGRVSSALLRETGLRAAVESAGGSFGVMTIETTNDQVAREVIGWRPEGIVCVNDLLAAELMPALFANGCRIPEDCAMAGFDDITYASVCRVPLTTIHQPQRELADMAVATLVQRIKEPELPPRQILIPGHLVERRSTAGPDEA